MSGHDEPVQHGEILEESEWLTLRELSALCEVHAERIITLVDEGVIEPGGAQPAQWRFAPVCVRRVRVALRLEYDLGLNPAGAALVMEMRDELQRLRARLRALEARQPEL